MLKRLFDIVLSMISLILFSPLLIISALLVAITSKGPIFFKQARLGKNGKIFKLYKFRTMTHKSRNNAKEVFLDNQEVTRIGKILRRFKIDELTQLINILKGDMSFVGPRPCLPELRKEFDKNGEKRLLVRPGLSGLAQINGNIYISWPERWKYDAEYVERQSFILDFKIIFKSFLIIIFGEDKFIKKPNA